MGAVGMRTLHVGLGSPTWVAVTFSTTLRDDEVARAPESPIQELVMLKLPDDPFVALEAVHDPARGSPSGRLFDPASIGPDMADCSGGGS